MGKYSLAKNIHHLALKCWDAIEAADGYENDISYRIVGVVPIENNL